MPIITAYHPCISITDEQGQTMLLRATLRDWMADSEFLEEAARVAGTNSTAELVTALRRGVDLGEMGCTAVRVG